MPKKIIISFLTAIYLIFFALVPHVSAQSAPGTWYDQNFHDWSNKVFDPNNSNEIFGERYTYAQVNWIINSLIAIVIGSDITKCFSTSDLKTVAECASKLAPATESSPGGGHS